MNIIFLLLGFFAGIVVCNICTNYISPLLVMNQEVQQYKKTDEATIYNLNSQRQMYEFYREFPEAKEQPEEHTNAIGFEFTSSNEEIDDDEEEDRLSNKYKVGF